MLARGGEPWTPHCGGHAPMAGDKRVAVPRGSPTRCNDRTSERLHEILELGGGPALERGAPLLIGGDHRVAVVPVETRLGVQPERAARSHRYLPEQVGARVAAVGAGVAEHDHRGT